MITTAKPKPEDGDLGLPTVDRSGHFPQDARLRKHGYKIHSRRKGEEPVWEMGGALVQESMALGRIDN